MENQKSGYIPLYRSVKKKAWAKDVYLRTLWENLLLDAARQPYTASYKGHQWELKPGQLVTTSESLGLSLCDRKGEPTSRHAIERMLAFFEKEGMISVTGERRKGTVITITNFALYAEKTPATPAHNSEHSTAHDEDNDNAASCGYPAHNVAQFTAHHEQEGNNKNINNLSSENSDESSDARLKKFLSAHPEAAIYTPSGAKWGSAEDLKTAQWISTRVKLINPTCKAPDMTSWSNTVRLMRQIDNRSHQDICALYDWASKHHFWQTNILSPESLRKQWDKLTMQRNAGGEQRAARQELDFNNTDWAYGVIR